MNHYTSYFWNETSQQSQQIASEQLCFGYDVHDELCVHANYWQYLYLIFTGKRLSGEQNILFERLAMLLLNLGPSDAGIQSAMNGGVGGSHPAANLYACMATSSGNVQGANELAVAMQHWHDAGESIQEWKWIPMNETPHTAADVFPKFNHPPGFEPRLTQARPTTLKSLNLLCQISQSFSQLNRLKRHRAELEQEYSLGLSLTGVVACGFLDLRIDWRVAQYLFLMLKLPGAAAHALEQQSLGWKNFPFNHQLELLDPPKARKLPDVSEYLR